MSHSHTQLLAVASVALALAHSAAAVEPVTLGAVASLGGQVQRTSIAHIFAQGGLIMWPLLLASLVSMTVVFERVIFLLGERRRRSEKELGAFFAEVRRGNHAGAIALARGSGDSVVATLGYGLERQDQSLALAIGWAESRTLRRYRRGILVLDTVITLAPLLGLLGTVTGMMGSFSMMGGELGTPAGITGGIAEALIATAFGLCIAIATLVPFNYLNNRAEEIETELASVGNQLRLLVEGNDQAPAVAEGS
jgi:biopolymer transport protein ExbB